MPTTFRAQITIAHMGLSPEATAHGYGPSFAEALIRAFEAAEAQGITARARELFPEALKKEESSQAILEVKIEALPVTDQVTQSVRNWHRTALNL